MDVMKTEATFVEEKYKPPCIERDDIESFISSLNEVPCLEQIIEIRLLIGLWYNEIFLMKDTHIIFTNETRKKIRCSVVELPFEQPIVEKLQFYSDVIGDSIQSWMDHMHVDCAFTNEVYFYAMHYVQYIVWTPRGQVNYLKTALALLENDDIDVHVKFLIAGNYCLMDHVTKYLPLIQYKRIQLNLPDHPVARYWWMFASGMVEPTVDAFQRIMVKVQKQQRGSSEALKFFWEMLPAEERENCVSYWLSVFQNETFTDFEPIQSMLRAVCEDATIRYDDVEMSKKMLELLAGVFEEKLWHCASFDFILSVLTRIPEEYTRRCYRYYLVLARTLILGMKNEYKNGRSLTCAKCFQIFKTFWHYLSDTCRKFLLASRNITCSVLFFDWTDEGEFVSFLFSEMNPKERKYVLFFSPYLRQLAGSVCQEDWRRYVALIDSSLTYEESRKLKMKIFRKLLPLDLNWSGVIFIINKRMGLNYCCNFKSILYAVMESLPKKEDAVRIAARLFFVRVEELKQRRHDIKEKIYLYLSQCHATLRKTPVRRRPKPPAKLFHLLLIKIYTERKDRRLVELIVNYKRDDASRMSTIR